MDAFTLDLDALLSSAAAPDNSVPAGDAASAGSGGGGVPVGAVGVSGAEEDGDDEFDFVASRPVYRSLAVAPARTHVDGPALPADYDPARPVGVPSVARPSALSGGVRAAEPVLPPVVSPLLPLTKTTVAALPGTTPGHLMSALTSALNTVEYDVDVVSGSAFKTSICATVNCAMVNIMVKVYMRRGDAGREPELLLEFQRRSGDRCAFRRVWCDAVKTLCSATLVSKPEGFVSTPRAFEPLPVPAFLLEPSEECDAEAVSRAPVMEGVSSMLKSSHVTMQREAALTVAQASVGNPVALAKSDVLSTAAEVASDPTCRDPQLLTALSSAIANVLCACSTSTEAVAALSKPVAAAAALAHVLSHGSVACRQTLSARRQAARGLAAMAQHPKLVAPLREACPPVTAAAIRSTCSGVTDAALLRDAHTALRSVQAV